MFLQRFESCRCLTFLSGHKMVLVILLLILQKQVHIKSEKIEIFLNNPFHIGLNRFENLL